MEINHARIQTDNVQIKEKKLIDLQRIAYVDQGIAYLDRRIAKVAKSDRDICNLMIEICNWVIDIMQLHSFKKK